MAASHVVVLPLHNPLRPPDINIVVVPDFAKDGTQPENSQSWIDSIMGPDAQARIFRFQYVANLSNKSIWHQLSEKGEDLLRILCDKAATYKILEMPLIFIGLGLGGLVVKRALSVLSDTGIFANPAIQADSKDILNMVAGVLFFGTPHTTNKKPEHWSRLTSLLSFAAKLPKRFLAHSEADANTAAIICESFEQSGFSAPVLSIFETRPTKVRSAHLWLKNTVMLVDKSFAETWAPKEKLLANDTTHDGVATFLAGSAVHQEVGLLLKSALSMRRYHMTANAFQESANRMDLWEDSITQVSPARTPPEGRTLQPQERHDSEDANFGSSLPSNFDVVPANDMGEYVQDEPESKVWPCDFWDGKEERHDFVGRDDTFQVIDDCFFPLTDSDESRLSMRSPTLPCCCISGIGGMGKTQAAIQYGVSRRRHFDAIFFVQADNSAKLSETFYKIACILGLVEGTEKGGPPNEEVDLVVARSKAMKWLSSPKFSMAALTQRSASLGGASTEKLNWLLIFDNVENSSILRDYWPVGQHGCILVTTRDARNSNYLRSQGNVKHIYLDKLGTAFASKLLLQLSYIDQTDYNATDASEIVDNLGGLPLAIEQVAAYIHGRGMTLYEFRTLYDKTLLKKDTSNSARSSWSHEIAASWNIDSLSAPASALIRIYSFVDPDGIHDSILQKAKVQTLPTNYPADELLYIDARGELLKSSLIRVNMSATPVVIRMHRLVQDVVLARMTTLQRLEIFSFVANMIFEAWPFTDNNWDHQAGVWSTHEALLQHIIRLAHIAGTCDLRELDLEVKKRFLTLLSSGGWYRQERGDFDTGIPLFELGIQICATSPDDFLDLRADLCFGLGGATCDTNRWPGFLKYAEEQLHYRMLSDAKNGVPPTSNTAVAYSELGLAQALTGRYEEGVQNCDIAIELYSMQPEVVDGSFSPAFPHFHRALALVGAGRPQAGEQPLLDLIRWHEIHFGSAHKEFKLGYAWHCCGLIYARTGRQITSLNAYHKAYANYLHTVGPLYHRTGNVCGKIAEHYASLRQFEAAEFYFQRAWEAYSSQPHYKPELARHFYIESQAFKDYGNEVAAEAALNKSQELYNEIVPHAERVSLTLDVLNGIVAPWVW